MQGRPRWRACLESGLKLDINRLARGGFVRPGALTGPVGIVWTNNHTEYETRGFITADMRDIEGQHGWFRIQTGSLDQRIHLIARPRHFGGVQWFFVCPYMSRRAMVLWMPPGARNFSCRQRWGRQVAYASQFLDRDNRAHRGQAKINAKLCRAGGYDPDDWDLPPKPKWMRWRTYDRQVERFERYESVLDAGTAALVARFLGRI